MDTSEQPMKMKSARHRRAMSAIARPSTRAIRPPSAGRPRRPYSAYTKRGNEEETPKFDAPETNREWWRYYMRETPVPGTYRHRGFLDELQKQSNSYHFRDTSRVKSASHMKLERSGQTLMPGIYTHEDFLQRSAKKKTTFGFKSIEREEGPKIGHTYGDKELDTSPTLYDVVDYTGGANEKDEKTGVFKSQVKRVLSAPQFRIVKGPGPGLYESPTRRPADVSSVFKSKVPRFHSRPSRVPGPGSYTWCDSPFGQPQPLPAAIHHLKKKHGIAVT